MLQIKGDAFDSAFLLSAAAAWIAAAGAALVISTAVLYVLNCGEAGIGYACSTASFLAAVAGGIAAGKKRRSASLFTAAITAVVLVTLLLTVGYIIAGEKIEASCVLSVVSFTFAGCMFGTVICGQSGKKRKKFSPKI